MNLKTIFTIIVILAGIITGYACIEDDPGPYAKKPFHVAGNSEISNSNEEETIDFWTRYCEGNISKDAISNFFSETDFSSYSPATSSDVFITWLRSNKKKQALDYIGYCLELNKIQKNYNETVWEYEKPDRTALNVLYKKVKDKKAPGELGQRYQFLNVRILAALQDDAALIDFWNKKGVKMEDSPLTRRIKGYIGGAYYRRKDYVSALDYFDSANDPSSVAWCIEKLVGADNLRKLYEHAPNSVAINYIIEDYINYLIEAIRDPERFQSDMNFANEMYNIPIYNPKDELKGFLQLADLALTEGKTENPLIWATVKGVAQVISGDKAEGLNTLRGATGLNGDDKGRENLKRFIGWAILENWDGNDKNLASELASSITDICQKAVSADNQMRKNNRGNSEEWYGPKHLQHFFYDFFSEEVIRKFELINPGMALCYMQYVEDSGNGINDYGYVTRSILYLDNQLTDSQMKQVEAYFQKPVTNDIDRLLKNSAHDAQQRYNETMGTRLIRKGKFKEAAEYLENVNARFLTTMAITPYLNRGYYRAMWGDYNFIRKDFSESWTPYYCNRVKLDYCYSVLDLIDEYNKAQRGDEKADKALKLASLMHIASPDGDCWAISEYYRSCSDQENEMTGMSREWLKKALAENPSDRQKGLIYYGLLRLPMDKQNRPTDQSWDEKWEYNLSGDNLAAMRWLKNNRQSLILSNAPDFITSCDAIISYIR